MPLFGGPNIDKLEAKEDVKGLVKVLEHPEPSVRARAVQALGRLSYETDGAFDVTKIPGIGDLLRVLGGRVETVGWKSVVVPRDNNPAVRAAAAEALGSLGLRSTLTALLGAGLAKDISGDAALRAFEAVGLNHLSQAGELLKRGLFSSTERWNPETSAGVVERLTSGFVAEVLLASIWGNATDHFVDVVRVIRAAGADAVAPCLKALDSQEPMRRCVAACVLSGLPDKRALGPLVTALDDEDKDVRAYAARALEALHDERAEKALAEFNARPRRPPVERRPLP